MKIKRFRTESMEDQYALCIENRDCDDLEQRKLYRIVRDEEAAKEGYLRVMDESGEGYLYPQSYFVIVDVPRQAHAVLRSTE